MARARGASGIGIAQQGESAIIARGRARPGRANEMRRNTVVRRHATAGGVRAFRGSRAAATGARRGGLRRRLVGGRGFLTALGLLDRDARDDLVDVERRRARVAGEELERGT